MSITNIKVTFGRKVKPGDYESADAIVELSGVVEEGEDAIVTLNHMAATAKAKALEMLGLKKSSQVAEAAPVTGSGAVAPLPQAQPAGAASAPGTKEAAAASLNAADAAPKRRGRPPANPPAPAPVVSAATSVADISDISDIKQPEVSVAADDLDSFLSAPAKPITDVELNDAAQKAFKKLNRPDAGSTLRGIAQKLIPEGKALNIANIPQEKRQEYLDKITAIA